MSDFRTVVSPGAGHLKIGLTSRITTIGSCFSEAIGNRLCQNKFTTLSNPFGVVYNPLSIHRLLAVTAVPGSKLPSDGVVHDGLCYNLHLHSSINGSTEKELQDRIDRKMREAHAFFSQSTALLITYGTSWVYRLKETGEAVANCHKQPSKLFEKTLMAPEEIIHSFDEMLGQIRSHHPRLKIVLTVSPVRHLKDSIELNAVSKSILRYACHSISEKHGEDVEYFPAYEIMMDDLRDYRFYKKDMIHPTEVAEDYIWNAFCEKYMDKKTLQFLSQWKSISDDLHHRPFHVQSRGHQIFLKQLLHKLETLRDLVNVEPEISFVQNQLLDGTDSK